MSKSKSSNPKQLEAVLETRKRFAYIDDAKYIQELLRLRKRHSSTMDQRKILDVLRRKKANTNYLNHLEKTLQNVQMIKAQVLARQDMDQVSAIWHEFASTSSDIHADVSQTVDASEGAAEANSALQQMIGAMDRVTFSSGPVISDADLLLELDEMVFDDEPAPPAVVAVNDVRAAPVMAMYPQPKPVASQQFNHGSRSLFPTRPQQQFM